MYSKCSECIGAMASLGPLASKDLWAWFRGLLDTYLMHLSLGSSWLFSPGGVPLDDPGGGEAVPDKAEAMVPQLCFQVSALGPTHHLQHWPEL